MHLVIGSTVARHLDEARRKHGRDRGRGEQHLAEQLERLWTARDRDRPHVPDHRALGVEIGGADQQPAPLAVLLGHLCQEGIVHVEGDDLGKRRVARERVAAEQPPDRLHDGDVLGVGFGEDLFQGLVVFRPEKGEGRGERAGRDAGDEVEFGPLARCGPAAEHPCPERAVGAAARQRKEIDDGSAPLCQKLGTVGADLRPFLATMASALGGSSSPQKRIGVGPMPTTSTSPSSDAGTGLRAMAAAQPASVIASSRAHATRPTLSPIDAGTYGEPRAARRNSLFKDRRLAQNCGRGGQASPIRRNPYKTARRALASCRSGVSNPSV